MAASTAVKETDISSEQHGTAIQVPARVEVALRTLGLPNATVRQTDFWDTSYEWRRLFSEALGTFLLVTAAVGGGLVNARFGGHAISPAARVVSPALMVAAVILFMGAVSGAHLNPAVSLAFALRGDFPWRRLAPYIVGQFGGAILATLVLVAMVGKHGSAGLTLPGPGISTVTAMGWEILLTAGLVSVILGTASGAQQVGGLAALGVGSYIALAGLFGAPVSGASMNPARSLGPALVLADWRSWWAYLVGPVIGALIAVGFAQLLRGRGGGEASIRAAQGTLGTLWRPGLIGVPSQAEARPGDQQASDQQSGDQHSGDQQPGGQQPGGQQPGGQQPGGQQPGGQQPGRPQPSGQQPGDHPPGDGESGNSDAGGSEPGAD